MNPALRDMLDLFEYEHLPEHLQEISKPFNELAWQIASRPTQRPAEQMACLRKLREAKDCAVTSSLPLSRLNGEEEPQPQTTTKE